MLKSLAQAATWKRVGTLLVCGFIAAFACSRSKEPDGEVATGGEGGAGGDNAPVLTTAGKRTEAGQGTGGSAGEATAGSGGSELGWLNDPEAWVPITTLPGCRVKVSRDAALNMPRHAFAACGGGCESASVVPGDPRGLAYILGTASRVVDDNLVLALSTAVLGEPPVSVVSTYSFGDGQPNVLMAAEGDCLAQVPGPASPQIFQVFPPEGEAVFKVAWLDTPSSTELEWIGPTTTRFLSTFDYGSGWGGIEAHAEAFVAEPPLSVDLTSVYQSEGFVTMPAGHGGIAVWGEWVGTAGHIVAWSPGKTAAVVASGSWYPGLVGASAERLVWLGAQGPQVTDGAYASAKLYWCARGAEAACDVVEGPSLPIQGAKGFLAVHDHWVALTGCSTACDAHVVDTTTGAVHRVTRVASDHGIQVIGISASHLFAADFGPTHRGTPEFDRLLRYDLSKLSDFAVAL